MGFEEETLTEIEEYLSANNFSAVEIQNIFDTYKIYPDDVQFRIIKKPKTLFKDEFGALKVAYAAMMNQFNVLCSGDKGTGKNVMIQTWAWITQRPLFELSVFLDQERSTLKLKMAMLLIVLNFQQKHLSIAWNAVVFLISMRLTLLIQV